MTKKYCFQGTCVAVARGVARCVAIAGTVTLLGAALHEREAAACGACFVGSSESTVVNDHRMALSISMQATILWDQIRYSGDPKEFAYVIPARPGTRIELSNEAWFAALDASTRPIIMSPATGGYGGGYGGGGGGGYYPGGGGRSGDYYSYGDTSGGGGCCSSMSALSSAEAFPGGPDQYGAVDASAGTNAGQAQQADPVQVVQQQVIGPYETVTLRSDDPDALSKWLADNGFNLPDEAKPIIADYVKDKLDFIAMRLRPTTGVRAMEPIRIVSPGADQTLPLRMMRIGAGQRLGITLFVIAEGRYQAANFPNAVIDPQKLIWDYAQRKSNYQQLSSAVMSEENGRTWLTEYAQRPSLDATMPMPSTGMIGNPGLAAAYVVNCPASIPYVPIDAGQIFGRDSGSDGGTDATVSDAGPSDASVDSAVDVDAAPPDAGPSEAGTLPPPKPRTKRCDDLDVAIDALHPADVWVTRMRAFLPTLEMEKPLELMPAPTQSPVENVHYAASTGTVAGLRWPDAGERGTFVTVLAACAALLVKLRRRGARR
jgi:hypothetical protein